MLIKPKIYYLIHKSFDVKLKSVCIQSIRTHFKFYAKQGLQQTNVINKIVNRNRQLLDRLRENRPMIVSKGAPDTSEDRAGQRGVEARVSTRRMTVLNKLLMQSISDVLSTEQMGAQFNELQVRITQVKVNKRYDSVNIYWISKCDETEKVAKSLDQLKGRLHQHLMDRQLMNTIPWIQFVLDLSESRCQEVDRVLKRCDFGPDFKPFNETLFETPYERVSRLDEKPNNKMNSKFERNEKEYQLMKLQNPNDMELNCLGLDYQFIMDIVLANLFKSRAQHRSFNAVADPLPPPDWSTPPVVNTNNEFDGLYNTEQRIKVMKQFLIENRKKREKLARNAKRKVILEEMQIKTHLTDAFDSYEDYSQQMEQELEQDLDSYNTLDNESNDD